MLLKLAQEAFKTSGIESFESWKKQRIQESPTANYWFTAIDLILILFMFVKSIRESNFKLYVKVIELMLPWYFALDHTNYSRWLTIALDDLKSLKIEDLNFIRTFQMESLHLTKQSDHFQVWEKIKVMSRIIRLSKGMVVPSEFSIRIQY